MVKLNGISDKSKGSIITGLMDTLPLDKKHRVKNSLYSCPNCGRFFVVYRGEVECTCEAIADGRCWNDN
jgi:hypothetical protein